jgi:hypothetical protein
VNIAIVYDGSIRDNGSPRLIREAFCEVLGRNVPWYTEAAPIPEGHDLYIALDDGRDDLPLNIPGRSVYWAVDTHLGWDARLERARKCDKVYTAQKPAAETMRDLGIDATWLPLACSPRHHPTAVEVASEEGKPLAARQYDVAFVGHLQPPDQSNRIEFLDGIAKAFPSFRYEFGRFHRDMARVYHQSRVGLNHCVRTDLNMRTFELASIGVPQLADDRMDGLADLGFVPWVHYFPYDSEASAAKNARFALNQDELRQECAVEARKLVRSQHTYAHRVRTILADAGCVS